MLNVNYKTLAHYTVDVHQQRGCHRRKAADWRFLFAGLAAKIFEIISHDRNYPGGQR